MESKLKIRIIRSAATTMYRFTDYFKGFENVEAVRRIFGDQTEKVLSNLKVEFSGNRGYMGVSNVDGHLMVSAEYLKKGDVVDIYLDIIHELTHVKQFLDGKELFDNHYSYVERPTEIEAFCNAAQEAKRLGLSEEEICLYLRTDWMSDEDFLQLAKTLNIKTNQPNTDTTN